MMKRLSAPLLLSLLSLVILSASCSQGETHPTTPTGEPSAVGGRLSAYHWQLVDATNAAGTRIDALFPNADRPVQLDFADGRVSVSNACNSMGGSYTLTDGALSVGGLMQTEMACEQPLMDAERAIGEALSVAATLTHEGDTTLVLTTTNGSTLRFRGEPTSDTRFGGPGELVFFEIAPQRVACSHPMIPDYQCLHVRQVTYGADGGQETHGEWESFYQDIEGYTHEPGVRNVVRVRRYHVANPPADGSSLAYVLDMVIESELVTP